MVYNMDNRSCWYWSWLPTWNAFHLHQWQVKYFKVVPSTCIEIVTLDCDSQLWLLSVKVCYALYFTEAILGGKYALHSDKRRIIVVALGLQSQIGSETKAKSYEPQVLTSPLWINCMSVYRAMKKTSSLHINEMKALLPFVGESKLPWLSKVVTKKHREELVTY